MRARATRASTNFALRSTRFAACATTRAPPSSRRGWLCDEVDRSQLTVCGARTCDTRSLTRRCDLDASTREQALEPHASVKPKRVGCTRMRWLIVAIAIMAATPAAADTGVYLEEAFGG